MILMMDWALLSNAVNAVSQSCQIETTLHAAPMSILLWTPRRQLTAEPLHKTLAPGRPVLQRRQPVGSQAMWCAGIVWRDTPRRPGNLIPEEGGAPPLTRCRPRTSCKNTLGAGKARLCSKKRRHALHGFGLSLAVTVASKGPQIKSERKKKKKRPTPSGCARP